MPRSLQRRVVNLQRPFFFFFFLTDRESPDLKTGPFPIVSCARGKKIEVDEGGEGEREAIGASIFNELTLIFSFSLPPPSASDRCGRRREKKSPFSVEMPIG